MTSIENRLDHLERLVEMNPDNDVNHYHPIMIASIVILFGAIFILCIVFGNLFFDSPANYYDSADSFCKHFNMTYTFTNSLVEQSQNYCNEYINDTIVSQKKIVEINNKWFFKE